MKTNENAQNETRREHLIPKLETMLTELKAHASEIEVYERQPYYRDDSLLMLAESSVEYLEALVARLKSHRPS